MLVKDVITTDSVKLSPVQSLQEALIVIKNNPDKRAVVLDEQERVLGLLTWEGVIDCLLAGSTLQSTLQEMNITTPLKIYVDEILDEKLLAVFDQVVVVDREERFSGFLNRERFMFMKLACENEMDMLTELISQGVIILDPEGRFVFLNKTAEMITGLARVDVLGQSALKMLPEFGLDRLLREKICCVNHQINFRDSSILLNSVFVYFGDNEAATVVVFEDITRKQALMADLKCKQNVIYDLDAIINSSYDGIYITDATGLTLMVNSAYERITGCNKEELVGQYVEDLVKKGILSNSITKQVVRRKEPITILQRVKNGKQVVNTGSPIMNKAGEVEKVVTNVRDLTELNRLSEQLEKTRALSEKYESELLALKKQHDIIIKNEKMRKIMEKVSVIAKVDSSVMLLGESGVGKEIIATAIHEASGRKNKPFIKINCGAIPENLLESELFGYEPGAFTGANKSKPGMLELAHEGTLFLDEVAEMPLNLQVKLLRVLQDQVIVRLGGIRSYKINVRIITATNKDINRMVQEGRFREDLYYRLNVIPIQIPPLRERKSDIPILINHFLNNFNDLYGREKQMDRKVMDILMDYKWPGNVRELKNLIEMLVVCSPYDMITLDDVPETIFKREKGNGDESIVVNSVLPLKEAVEELESKLFNKAYLLSKTSYEVARVLKISQPTAFRKMKKYLSDTIH